MRIKPSLAWSYAALIVVLTGWILQGFLQALLAALVTAIASWPLYAKLAARLQWRIGQSATAAIFTLLISVFVLAPMTFAFWALLTEVHAFLLQVAAADQTGFAVPQWLESVPLVGPWAADRWESDLAQPGALRLWTQRTDATALLGWAQSLGHFMARHMLIVLFTILLVFFVYKEGDSLAGQLRRALSRRVGTQAGAHLDLATRAMRASVNSMLIVSLFDGLATGIAFTVVGVPHAAVWAAITASLAIVPFLGYVAVSALVLQLVMVGAGTPALLSFWLGFLVLLCGDKIVRPIVSGHGTRLPFVWVLLGCLGGFEALGLVGLVIGPVVLTLARELWGQGTADLAPSSEARPDG